MNKPKTKLMLKKETLRDLTAQNATDIKAGGKVVTLKKKCATAGCLTWDCPPAQTPMCW